MSLKPEATFRAVRCPMLIIGGEKDLQCEPADVSRIAALAEHAETTAHVVPDLTHVLRLDPGEPSLLHSHHLLGEPVAPVVVTLVTEWIREQQVAATNMHDK